MAPFLVVRPGAIGDALLAAPALAALRTALRGAELVLIAHAAVGPLMLREGLADRFIARDAPAADALFAATPRLAHDQFGAIEGAVAWTADPDGRLRANLAALSARPPILAPSRPPEQSGRHVAEHLLGTLAHLGVAGFDPAFCLPSVRVGRSRPRGGQREVRPRVVIHPGSGSPRKNWPAERFAAVAEALGARTDAAVEVLLGPAEAVTLDLLKNVPADRWRLHREPPLADVAELLADCDLYLGNDSGLSQLAGLSGAPTLVLFGPTDPRLWRPLGPRVNVLHAERLESLAASTVLEAALRLLEWPAVGIPTG